MVLEEHKSDNEIIDTLIEDTLLDLIHWDCNDAIIFSEVMIKNGIYLVFEIIDEEEEDEYARYLQRYAYYEMNQRIISLRIFLKKSRKKIFIKQLIVSQMKLIELLEYISPKLKS